MRWREERWEQHWQPKYISDETKTKVNRNIDWVVQIEISAANEE